jgi:hypothetical protein
MTKESAGTTLLTARSVMDLGEPKQFGISLLTQEGKMLPAKLHLDQERGDGKTCLRGSVSFSPDPGFLQEQPAQAERIRATGIPAAGPADELNVRASDLSEYVPKLGEVLDDVLPILEESYESGKDLDTADLNHAQLENELQKIITDLKSGTGRTTESADYFHGLSADSKEAVGQAVDIGQLLRTCAELTRSLRGDNNIELGLTLDGGLSEIEGDKAQLEYIFLNILFKAHDFLDGSPGRISVTASRSPSVGDIRIEIETTAAVQNERKVSLRTDETTSSPNFRLGSIHKLLRTLNGRFGMKSIHKGGILFQIEIPVPMSEQQKDNRDALAAELS